MKQLKQFATVALGAILVASAILCWIILVGSSSQEEMITAGLGLICSIVLIAAFLMYNDARKPVFVVDDTDTYDHPYLVSICGKETWPAYKEHFKAGEKVTREEIVLIPVDFYGTEMFMAFRRKFNGEIFCEDSYVNKFRAHTTATKEMVAQ